jgi:hypothetical protein
MEKTENLNRKYHLKVVPKDSPKTAPANIPPPPVVFHNLIPEKPDEIWNDIIKSMDGYFSTNSPRLAGFSFVAKCELLSANEWASIIDPVREKHPEIRGWSCSEILKYLCSHTGDPQADQVYNRLKQHFL